MLITALAVLFALALAGFALLLRRPAADRTPVPRPRSGGRNSSPDLFVPTDPSQKSFPRGTSVR